MFFQVIWSCTIFIFKGSKHLKVLFHPTLPEFLGWGFPIFPYSQCYSHHYLSTSLWVSLFEVHNIGLRHPLNHSFLPTCPSSYHNAYQYYCGRESLRRNGVPLMVNKRVWNAVLGCNLKNDRMISVSFQGTTIQYHGNPRLCPDQ